MTTKYKQPGQAAVSVDTTISTQVDSSRQTSSHLLRQMAEEYLREQNISPPKIQEALSIEETQRIIFELQTHQIELEIQNEELRQSQVELEISRKRYFDFYDLAPVGYCTVSEKGLILETNLTVANFVDRAREALLNQPFSSLVLKEDQDIFYLLRKQLLKTGESQSGELRLIHQDRTSFWVKLETTVGRNESGMTVIRLILSDINKRKRTEEALLKSHHQNQVILGSIADAFISLSDDMVVNFFNAAAERMFNRDQVEIIGRKLFDVFPEGKGSIFEDNCFQVNRTKLPMAFEIELKAAPYQNWYGVRVYPSLVGITIYLRVITERKKIEEAKVRLHKAESLERMAGSIAHLFNNHLQVALGNLEMAINGLATDPVHREYLINAMQANQRSADVNGLLLTYLGQKIGKVEQLDLSQICQQILPGIKTAVSSNVSIETNLIPPGPFVCANASQIHQILNILISNACEAIGDHTGRVTVVTEVLSAFTMPNSHVSYIECVTAPEMCACLEVTDTGCGMSEDEMAKIFDPFYTTKFTGRGLGLAVAMSLARAWGGTIQVYSNIQKGSCFRVILPLFTDVVPEQTELLIEPKALNAKGTVLLVDDDPSLREVIEAILEHLGFTVLVATNGIEAVALFQKHQTSINCLLTDLSMEGMNGWDILVSLRKIKPDLPAIISSGYDEARVMHGDHEELPQAFLHKPYTKDDLNNVLNRVLGDATCLSKPED